MNPLNAVAAPTPINGLTRSRRSHFSRKDSSPELNGTSAAAAQNQSATNSSTGYGSSLNNLLQSAPSGPTQQQQQRIVHEYQRMMYYAKSPHSWALPANWSQICESFPLLVRNKVNNMNNHHHPSGMAGHRRDMFAMRSTSLTASLECTR